MRTPAVQFPGYKLVKLLGKGGMGEVFLAEDEALGRMEIFPGISMNPDVRFGKPCITGTRMDVATRPMTTPERRPQAAAQRRNVCQL